MKTKAIVIALTLILLASLTLSFSLRSSIAPAEPSEAWSGYNTQQDKWTKGNLGSAYVEGDWVSYQLRIDTASKVWGATEFVVSFNFHQDNTNAIYVDGFDISTATGFQYQIDGSFLPDGQQTPSPAWTHIPTPEAGEAWSSGPSITNYMDPWPAGTSEPSDPNSDQVVDERYFSVNGLPWGSATDNIILFFRAHLALSIIWSAGLESDLPQVLDGDEFNDWTNLFNGASSATGSSRHFTLQYPGIGDKTIPIPIAQYPSTIISGHKYVNNVLFDGWQITLTGQLTLGSGLPPIPYNPPSVLTGAPPWTTGYFEFTGLVTGSYTVDEEERPGYAHVNIVVGGDATNIAINLAGGWASFDLVQGGAATVDFYNSRPSRTTTLLSSSTITLGQSITDTATVTSTDGTPPIPTGTVTFYVGPSTSGPWTQVGAVKTLNASGNAVSDSYTPLTTGTYYFKAAYSGDSGYLPSESDPATEVLVVNKATPTVATLLSATSITKGGSVTDTVTVTGLPLPFPGPTGSVEFYVSTDGGVTWTKFGATKTLVGGTATSDSYTPSATGIYYFKAVYLGDSNYNGAESGATDEPLIVNNIRLIVTTIYDSSRTEVTFQITVVNLNPTSALTQVNATKTIGAVTTTVFGPVTLSPSGSYPISPAIVTETFSGHGTFIATFTAEGLDANGYRVWVDITITLNY